MRYPVPGFLLREFMYGVGGRKYRGCVRPLFLHLADGHTLRSAADAGIVKLPVTRRLSGYFHRTPGPMPVVEALRRAQVLACGGSERLARAIVDADIEQKTFVDEVRWEKVIRWFCRQPDVDPVQVGPLIDFIYERSRRDDGFRIKGRSIQALVRGMEAWHRELAQLRQLHGITFCSSGIPSGSWVRRRKVTRDRTVEEEWAMLEILNSKDLVSEGRAMRHCVASYSEKVANRTCSIWSLRCEGKRLLTVEVRHDSAAVVQYRGRFNRNPTPLEVRMIERWAHRHGLKVAGQYRW